MARRAMILVFLVATTGGCPELTRSDRRPQHRSGLDDAAPAAVAADDGVDEPPAPQPPNTQPPNTPPPGAIRQLPSAPRPLKLRPGMRPGTPAPGRPTPDQLRQRMRQRRAQPGRPAPSDVNPAGTPR